MPPDCLGILELSVGFNTQNNRQGVVTRSGGRVLTNVSIGEVTSVSTENIPDIIIICGVGFDIGIKEHHDHREALGGVSLIALCQ